MGLTQSYSSVLNFAAVESGEMEPQNSVLRTVPLYSYVYLFIYLFIYLLL
jgi:hypothetical protein